MYAVVQTGGKQYRVTPGDYVIVERLPGEHGDRVELNDILLIDNEGKVMVGQPFVKDASVVATIVNQNRADKIIVFKKKRRQNYRRKNGHRQLQSVLHISEISAAGATVKAENKPKVSPAITVPAEKAKKEAAPKAEKSPTKAAAPKAEKAPAEAAAPKADKAEAKPAAAKKPAAKKTTEK
jgi:large subunit ribosomal protein L21